METVTVAAASSQQPLNPNPIFPPKPQCLMLMNPPLAAFKQSPPLLLRLHRLCTAAASTTTAPEITSVPEVPPSPRRRNGPARKASSSSKVANLDAQQLKVNWLDSLSFPSKHDDIINQDSGWVIGVDPDLSGALAVLNPDNSPQVYDSPHLKVLVGKRIRKRLDAKSIVQLVQSVNAPVGTTVYIEQSIPYPQDGKQGWWSGGFGYGLWIGILVASGYSVVPVPSLVWKNEFKLAGNRSSKDDSRELASNMFPSMSDLLKRKKDHGRAEALLIAAYGKGLKLNLDSSCFLEKLMPAIQDDEQAVTL